MTNFEAFILGVLQGLTEFLPISSSGHLEIGQALFGLHPGNELLFTVILHGATVLSTIVVFRKEIKFILSGISLKGNNEQSSYLIKLLISAIPIVIVGLLFESEIKTLFFGNIGIVGIMLLITGLILVFAHFNRSREKPIGYSHSIIIGLAQVVAILPGISRSGATISTALLLGISREEAARFSFLMVLLPIIGANAKIIFSGGWLEEGYSIQPLLIGFIAAFISGYIACKWMLSIVKSGKLLYFAIYCFILGMSALIFHYRF
jgi:undecaprenyl-diphosphatase